MHYIMKKITALCNTDDAEPFLRRCKKGHAICSPALPDDKKWIDCLKLEDLFFCNTTDLLRFHCHVAKDKTLLELVVKSGEDGNFVFMGWLKKKDGRVAYLYCNTKVIYEDSWMKLREWGESKNKTVQSFVNTNKNMSQIIRDSTVPHFEDIKKMFLDISGIQSKAEELLNLTCPSDLIVPEENQITYNHSILEIEKKLLSVINLPVKIHILMCDFVVQLIVQIFHGYKEAYYTALGSSPIYKKAKERITMLGKFETVADKIKNRQCQTCGKKGIHLLKCVRCQTTMYCNRECQKTDWTLHKRNCRRIK